MSEKYEDLHDQIVADKTFDLTTSERLGAKIALQWLDQNRDQVPGRTITESQIAEAFGDEYHYWAKRRLSRIGITVVPDPEPTNRDRLQGWLVEFAERNASCGGERGDCDLAEFLDAHGVKAPEGS